MNITSSLSHDLALAAQHYFQRELRINFSTLKTEMDYIDRMHRRIEKLEFLWNNIMDMYLGNSRPIITMQSYFIHKTPQVTFDVISKKNRSSLVIYCMFIMRIKVTGIKNRMHCFYRQR